jgi:hypothetical protein
MNTYSARRILEIRRHTMFGTFQEAHEYIMREGIVYDVYLDSIEKNKENTHARYKPRRSLDTAFDERVDSYWNDIPSLESDKIMEI